MSRKSDIHLLADYVMSQQHERDHSIREAKRTLKDDPSINKSQMRKMIEGDVHCVAFKLKYGKAEAQKEMTEMLSEIYE